MSATEQLGAAASRGDDETSGVAVTSVDPRKVGLGVGWAGVVAPAQAGAQFPAGAQFHLTYVARKTRIDQSAGALHETPAYTTVDPCWTVTNDSPV